MKLKKISTILLLAFVAGSIAYMIGTEKKTESTGTKPGDNSELIPKQQDTPKDTTAIVSRNEQNFSSKAETEKTGQNNQLVVYYFHGYMRCQTCHKLEDYAKEVLDTYFADELAAGKFLWRPTNVDTPGNEHFVRDYSLVTKSVVASKIVDGNEVSWKNLDQIWQKVQDKDSYLEYIRDSITKFLEDEH